MWIEKTHEDIPKPLQFCRIFNTGILKTQTVLYIEILKYSLALHLIKMDTEPDPYPPKRYRSDRLRIHKPQHWSEDTCIGSITYPDLYS
jgi:hypothetical protein